MKITDDMLIAYIQGDLSPADRAIVEKAVAADPDVAERLRGHRVIGRLKRGALKAAPKRPGQSPAPVVSLAAARTKRAEPETRARPKAPPLPAINGRWTAIAVALVAGIAIGMFAPRFEAGLITSEMTAAGALKVVLDQRLAATQPADAPIKVQRSFRTSSNAWCRSFTSATLSGVACREGDGWQVRMAERGPPSTALAQAVAAMAPGAPITADTEKAALAGGWR